MGNISSDQVETTINCPIHSIPFQGVCSDNNCISGLICLKCEPEACSNSKGHELVSLDKFYLKNFSNTSDSIDYTKLNKTIENLKLIDREFLSTQIEKYSQQANSIIDEKLSMFNKNIAYKLEELKKNINMRLENLQLEYLEADSRIDFSSMEIPENFTIEETKKFFEKNKKSVREMENMINLVKKYSDNEKLQLNIKDMETIIYTRNISEQISNEIIKEKLDALINELKIGLNELTQLLVFNKESTSIFFLGLKKFNSNPTELKFQQDITDKCQKSYTINCVFTSYTTSEGNAMIAWASQSFEVVIYDLKSNKIIKSLSGHTQHVYIVRHFFFKKTSTDYLISTSYDKSCRVWDAVKFTSVLVLPNCHTGCYLYSALIVFEENDSRHYVVTGAPNEHTKIWDFETAVNVRNISSTTDYTYHLDVWYDYKFHQIYIINANATDVKIYNFETGLLYKVYKPDQQTWHMSACVHEINDIPYLFETDGNGYLRIWNLRTHDLYKKFQAKACNLRGICIWNDQYVISASSDKSFKIFDLDETNIAASISGHDNVLCSLDKIIHPSFGEVLISSAIDGKIKIWTVPSK